LDGFGTDRVFDQHNVVVFKNQIITVSNPSEKTTQRGKKLFWGKENDFRP